MDGSHINTVGGRLIVSLAFKTDKSKHNLLLPLRTDIKVFCEMFRFISYSNHNVRKRKLIIKVANRIESEKVACVWIVLVYKDPCFQSTSRRPLKPAPRNMCHFLPTNIASRVTQFSPLRPLPHFKHHVMVYAEERKPERVKVASFHSSVSSISINLISSRLILNTSCVRYYFGSAVKISQVAQLKYLLQKTRHQLDNDSIIFIYVLLTTKHLYIYSYVKHSISAIGSLRHELSSPV
jgi:hypothetical protein